jgi:phosphoglucosamine mutase
MSALARQFEPVPQILENVRVGGEALQQAQVVEAIAEGERRLNGAGRLVVRPSGTEPLIRIMAEGDDIGMVRGVIREIAEAVRAAALVG